MVHTRAAAPLPGTRHANLKRSFKLGVRSLLTAFSKEDVFKAFPTFSNLEKERLHHLLIQVIKSLHANMEEEFEAVCQETQVGSTLDTIEQLVEEQSLDMLSSEALNMGEVKETLARVKKDEICYLTSILEKAEKQNDLLKSRIESLMKQKDDTLAAVDAISKDDLLNDRIESMTKADKGTLPAPDAISMLRSWNSNYEKLLNS
uniref:Tetratricopeptide repeat protein 39A n=1 Tax=Anthurium amnicola TaxID=1678845 RepID=A0A1D1YH75_9ARAE